jgi:hypothetical protein
MVISIAVMVLFVQAKTSSERNNPAQWSRREIVSSIYQYLCQTRKLNDKIVPMGCFTEHPVYNV